MLRIVFDTNTLISASLNKNSVSGKAFYQAAETCISLASEETSKELKEVVIRSKFDKYASLESRVLFYENYLKDALTLPVSIKLNDCRDPKDNKFLELAVVGDAKVIVTGDSDLLVLHPFRGILIMNSAAFLDWIK